MKKTYIYTLAVITILTLGTTAFFERTTNKTVDVQKNDTFHVSAINSTLDKTLPTDYKNASLNKVDSIKALKEKTNPKTIQRARSKDGVNDSKTIIRMAALASKRAKIEKAKNEVKHIDYWQTVYSIESKQGKMLYRPKNTSQSCSQTASPCGHHQLTAQALKDIGCDVTQCLSDRLDYDKSLKMSQKLLKLNERRLRNIGIVKLDDYQKYLIHQQGASGIKNILNATKGKSQLSQEIRRNMANNSPHSYKQYQQMGSQVAAQTFLEHWETKWVNEKRLIAKLPTVATDNLIKPKFIPRFSDKELNIALNK